MKFRTYYGDKKVEPSNPGSRFKPEYQLFIDEKGVEQLKKTGETDVQKMIDSYKEMVDLDVILERLNNGDDSVLEQVEGFYADVSEIPVKLQDVMNLNLAGKQLFDGLPPDYKDLYGGNYESFVFDPKKLIDYINEKEYGPVVEKEVIDNDDKEQ